MTKGTEPPPSRYPRLTDLQLVAANKTAMGFPDIPGVPGLLNLVFDYDFGPDFDYVDESGLITRQPPVVKRVLTTLTDSGHQTSILTTNFQAPMTTLAVSLFARWSQENFFRYMREHYSLDRLIEYGTEAIPDAVSVVNPAWRKLDSQIRSTTGRRHRQAAQSGALALSEEPTESQVQGFQQRKGTCRKRFRFWIWRSTRSNNCARKRSITFP